MAVVESMTLARQLALEASTVVGGSIDGSGHLILTRHDGSTIDAGNALVAVPDKEVLDFLDPNSYTETTPPSSYPDGESLLYLDPTHTTASWPSAFSAKRMVIRSTRDATNGSGDVAQVALRLNSNSFTAEQYIRSSRADVWSSWVRVATTADLVGPAIVSMIAAPSESAIPSAYPLGVSITNVGSGSGWSLDNGFGSVITVYQTLNRAYQTFISSAGGASNSVRMWTRTYHDPEGWTNWNLVMTEQRLLPASFTQSTVMGSYPLGMSYIYMTNTETTAGGWDFGGDFGLVVTHRMSNDFAYQYYHKHASNQSGSGGINAIWKRSSNFPDGWSKWAKMATPQDPSTMGITGEVKMWAGNTVPNGWLLCDGSLVSRTTYANLFAVISTIYGAGDGSTTFKLPPMNGKVAVGYDAADTDFNAVGLAGGEKTHVLSQSEMPGHTHTNRSPNWNVTPTTGGDYAGFKMSTPDFSETTGSTGGGTAHNNMQPYVVMKYIIKT